MNRRKAEKRSREQRIVAIWLPRLAIERWRRLAGAPDDARVALVVEEAHGQRIAAATEAAQLLGARPGMRLTDARALDPGLQVVVADPAGDAALLERLARWASRWSPLVEIDGADGLRLDASGAAHLFGGENGLIADIQRRLSSLGLSSRVAIACTPGAAWALAHHGASAAQSCPVDATAARLAPLPVAALRLPPEVTRTLERLGLKRIGTLAGVERRPLARRFREADNPLDALDRMLGRKAEPLTAIPDDPPPRALLRLAEPVSDPAAAPQALDLLVPGLVKQLEARKLGARRLLLAGYRVDGEVAVAVAATALATREAKHLHRLLADKAGTLDPGFGFDGFALEAAWCEPLGAGQDGLIGGPPPALEVARLVDRLSVKLGPERVRRPQPRASHLPERASGWRPALEPAAECMAPPPTAPRPPRMLDRPEAIAVIYATPEGLPRRFVWRRAVHDVTRAEGPERIAPEWWRERSTARLRDYYRVEDREGRRYWIYREGLHGDGRGGDPVWYLHGLFG
ncbi:DNA polymerase Y family protein [Sphingomonas rhizophila]|uniref:DNA polymerase Y family protein n=1 Tax=Sphingomonas rhizophila TaxID=2071607 RepID=A0A7G9SAV8_9SPHN|nr:DNA polymerase Y family protein [Sphingomonas rhizophila]QNN64983.1 DNA polymerase Y family protein [Sphingomonas rhizophila]